MSRHRDIRSMNYSDEYDGYDDIYGHSVEDDYCVSPSAEQFLYDRNKQPNIASFINEPNIEEGDEEEEADLTSPKSSQLSELDRVKIISAIEIIRNVIGDTIPDTVLTEKIIKFDFDAVAALDDILKSTSPENQSESNASQEVCGKQESGIKSTPMPRVQVTTPSSIKVIPATSGSVTKGFDLSGIENSELRHPYQESLRSQNLLSEINAQNLRRKDDSTPRNNLDVFKTNALHCQSPHSGRATPEHDSKIKSLVDEKYDVITSYNNRLKESKEQLHLVVVGHVDAGKSTLLGRLLSDLGQVSSRLIHKYQQESKKVGKQSFAYAWVLDETGEERDRGITMDIGYSKFETETKSVTLLDAPGHKDFIPNMITGATQADVALLVVDATRGEFETGFDSGGQTREHALLLRSLGVLQIAVVINKLDMVDWSEDRYNEIVDKMGPFLKQVGFRDSVMFIPCSGLSGENIIESPKVKDLSKWYTGPNLLSVIDNFKCPERPVTKPFRFSINDIFKGTGSGFCVSGHVVTGMITVGNKVLLLPGNEIAIVKDN
ncbi:hypothetical protein PV327_002977 [Microctonus hyperodae]|uniref:Tr-type G domain-containing protein n=1 Tax=Microctonus hyperodae TaxID=165561 RepID=A0AA39G3C4_MICHY|nr:hypothetical protein PV327_002977 [Microctonus hyperodae]